MIYICKCIQTTHHSVEIIIFLLSCLLLCSREQSISQKCIMTSISISITLWIPWFLIRICIYSSLSTTPIRIRIRRYSTTTSTHIHIPFILVLSFIPIVEVAWIVILIIRYLILSCLTSFLALVWYRVWIRRCVIHIKIIVLPVLLLHLLLLLLLHLLLIIFLWWRYYLFYGFFG